MKQMAFALSAAIGLTLPAMAAQKNAPLSPVPGLTLPATGAQQNSTDPVIVRDATGTVIGRLLWEGVMARRYGDRVVSIEFCQEELDNNFVFFYATPNCSGQAYMETFYFRPVPDRTNYEQGTQTLYEGDPNIQITLDTHSATYGSGACDPSVVQTIIASPIIAIDSTSHGWTPPFRAQ
jgi:hypothetical protein